MGRAPCIVQVARSINPYGGVAGVAWQLDQFFRKKGLVTERIDMAGLRLVARAASKSLISSKVALAKEVVGFTISATRAIKRRQEAQDCVILVHGDALGGDIYVEHGVHKAFVQQDRWAVFRNPLHMFLLGREEVRHRFAMYRRVVAVSEATRGELLRCFRSIDPRRTCVIHNGVDTERFSPRRNDREVLRLRSQYATDGCFVMVFIGHRFERKGLRYAIESLTHLPNRVLLWVVGGDSGRVGRFRELARRLGVDDRVTFFGHRNDVPDVINAADAFVLPSSEEALPLVGLEAMACGVPVLMTRVGGIPEFLSDGWNGFFVEQSAHDIAQKVELLLRRRDVWRTVSARARGTALAYSWSVVGEKYLRVIDEVWEQKRRNG